MINDIEKKLVNLENLPGSSASIICTINPHSYVVATFNNRLRKAIRNADAIVCDGFGTLLAFRLCNISVSRVTGYDAFQRIMAGVDNEAKILLVGSTDYVLGQIQKKMKIEYGLDVFIHAPPFSKEIDETFVKEVQWIVDQTRPTHIFYGLTAPKQEILADSILYPVNTRCVLSIGAVFDFYAGTVSRSPYVMRSLGLEWLYRFAREPRRMFKRLITSLLIFPILVFPIFIKRLLSHFK